MPRTGCHCLQFVANQKSESRTTTKRANANISNNGFDHLRRKWAILVAPLCVFSIQRKAALGLGPEAKALNFSKHRNRRKTPGRKIFDIFCRKQSGPAWGSYVSEIRFCPFSLKVACPPRQTHAKYSSSHHHPWQHEKILGVWRKCEFSSLQKYHLIDSVSSSHKHVRSSFFNLWREPFPCTCTFCW